MKLILCRKCNGYGAVKGKTVEVDCPDCKAIGLVPEQFYQINNETK